MQDFCFFLQHLYFNFSQTQRSPHVFYRHDLINQLQHNHALVTLVAENLSAYMESMRQYAKGKLLNKNWPHKYCVKTPVENRVESQFSQ